MKYYSAKETAAIIRKCLKEAFPQTKFSVRSETFSGGDAVNVSWTDGPNVAQVEAITSRFKGSRFDGMQDMECSVYAMYQGEQCMFARYITTRREYSEKMTQRGLDVAFLKNATVSGILKGIKPTAEKYKRGEYSNDSTLQTVMRRNIVKMSEYATFDSKTARSVFTTHCDGYHSDGPINQHVVA